MNFSFFGKKRGCTTKRPGDLKIVGTFVFKRKLPRTSKVRGNSRHYIASSSIVRCARRMAFTFFMRFLTDGFVKNVRFLNSFKMPDRSYFFLNRRMARSIGSFSPMIIPTREITSLEQRCPANYICAGTLSIISGSADCGKFSMSLRSPSFSNETEID